ncbi:hypothetical protein [Paraburkholderia sp. J7]|uniref:hypothetical protein n=1 Tax=Paraburkholderia sp. J7 TaxID=2805438 RepID=UPI002AB780DC|nr:hypothetical protein [Paraburkholderia sp. J7]
MSDGEFERATDFHFREVDALRDEIQNQLEYSRKITLYVVVGMAAFLAWFWKDGCSVQHGNWVPLLIVVGGATRSLAASYGTKQIASYLRALEAEFTLHALRGRGPAGWETYLNPRGRTGLIANVTRPRTLVNAIFWLFVTGVAIFVAFAPITSSCGGASLQFHK